MSYAKVLNYNIFFVKMGEEGAPLLFIHGIPTSSAQWKEIQQNLSDVYQTFNIDLIGMGQSDKPLENWNYTFENDAKLIAALLDNRQIDKMSLCGDDLGGGVALTFAHNFPERVERLMIFDTVAYDNWPVPEIENLGALASLSNDELANLSPEIIFKLSQLLRTMMNKPSVFTGLTSRQFLEPYRTNDYSPKGGYGEPKLDGLKALILRAQALDPRWMLELDLSKIKAACLVGWGQKDIYMDPLGMYKLKDDLGGQVRMELIPDAGHLCMLDKPLEITELIDDFMSEWQTAEEAAAA